MGSPFFKNMEGNKRKMEQWNNHRQLAYEGSIMHFMRSLYRNTLSREGFTMNTVERYVNSEKQRIKKIYKENLLQNNTLQFSDSTFYYSRILKQSDSLDYVHPQTLPSDSVSYAYDSTTAVLSFKGFLQISYAKKKLVPSKDHFAPSVNSVFPKSIIRFINKPEIHILSDGTYYEPGNIMVEQFWALSEKLSNCLPVNYKTLGN